MDVALFSPDYVTVRGRFLEAAAALGSTPEAHAIEAQGPGGEELAIDVAMSPDSVRGPALVVSSGIHGVEGYFGSAVQLGLLERWGRSRAGGRDYLYAAAEFGTYPERHVLGALRAENQCHHWGRPEERRSGVRIWPTVPLNDPLAFHPIRAPIRAHDDFVILASCR